MKSEITSPFNVKVCSSLIPFVKIFYWVPKN